MNKRKILIVIGFIILLIAIPVTLYLVRQQQILKSRAAFIPKVEFVDRTGQVITETDNSKVKLRITRESVSESPGAE